MLCPSHTVAFRSAFGLNVVKRVSCGYMRISNFMSLQWMLTIWSVPDCFEHFKTIRDKCWCHSGVQTKHNHDSNGDSVVCTEHNLSHHGSIVNIWRLIERWWMADEQWQPDSATFICIVWHISEVFEAIERRQLPSIRIQMWCQSVSRRLRQVYSRSWWFIRL